MKKHILFLAAICSCFTLFAGQEGISDDHRKKNGISKAKNATPSDGLMQSPPFFSEDFASGIPAGWTNVDNSGNGVLWRTTTTGAINTFTPVDPQLNPNGTSALNGYLILDSDSAGSGLTENSELTTVPINCTGRSVVHLSFNEYFAQFGSSSGIVQVSNDNATWVDFHHAEAGLVQDSATANPYPQVIDISSTAANKATVYLRFKYQGAFDYWWFVDDVQLYEPSATDLSVQNIQKLSSEYTRIPLSQATSLTLSAEIVNVGLNTTGPGTALLELVDAGSTLTVFSEVVNVASLAPGGSQTVVPSSGFAPSTAGTYYSRVSVTIAGDGNAANDVAQSDNIIISDSVYGRDDDAISGVQQIGAGAGEDGIAGQNFKVNSSADLTSVTIFLKDTFSFNAAGTPLFLTIHPQVDNLTGPDGAVVLASTETLLLFPGMIPAGGAFYTIPIQGGFVHLNPGLYFIGFHENADMIPMGVTSTTYSQGAVWVHFNSIPSPPAVNGWAHVEDFGFQFAYMIRANFGILPDAVSEITPVVEPMVFPNPSSSGIFNILMDNPDDNFKMEIFNTMGQCVKRLQFQNQLNLSLMPNGIYTLHIFNKDFCSVKRLCISGK